MSPMHNVMHYSKAAWLALALGTLLVVGAGCVGSASRTALEQEGGTDTVLTETATKDASDTPASPDATTGPGDAVPDDADAGTEVDAVVVREIPMTARQWEFEPSEVRVTRGETVRLVVRSVDVDHGLMIPAYDIDQYLEPGKTVTVEFTADTAGTFPFFCNVFCGSGHQHMSGTLIVE